MSNISLDQMPPAVVIGLCAHGLATVRSLARIGAPVHALECDSTLPGFRTRCATVHHVQEIHGQALIDALCKLAEHFNADCRPILFPVNDKMVECIADHWDELGDRYRLSWQDCRDSVRRLLHKSELERYCTERGLPYPVSRLIRSTDDVEQLSKECIFPQIVKPSRPLGTFKTQLAYSRDQLLDIAIRYQVDYPLLAQPWIEGDDSHLYFCGLYMDRGHVIARFDGHKLRSLPPTLGQTLIAEGVIDNELFELTNRFFDGLDISGPVSLEIKRDLSGNIWIIEPTVGRTDYWVPVCIENGVPFPAIEYCHVAGLDHELSNQKCDCRWFDTERDPFCFLRYMAVDSKRGKKWRAVFPYWYKSDQKPFSRALLLTLARFLVALRKRIFRVFS